MVNYFELLMETWAIIKQTTHKQQKLEESAISLLQAFYNSNVDTDDIRDVMYEDEPALINAFKEVFDIDEDDVDSDFDDCDEDEDYE